MIAEVKKASPSKGVIRADFDPVAIARTYAAAGASALSILTDRNYFQGSLEYLKAIRSVVDLPLLRKDFIIDEYQVYEAARRRRRRPADCRVLDGRRARALVRVDSSTGYAGADRTVRSAEFASCVGATGPIVGVNNRDLHTFVVDLEHTLRLQQQIPADRRLVAESGIASRADVLRLQEAGVAAMLVGESLMRQPDISLAVHTLLGKQ